jgi:hypothetical protein
VQQRLDARILETQSCRMLVIDESGPLHFVKCIFADCAVMADALDVEETSIGFKADLPECGKVPQPLSDVEVAGVVDRRFSSKGSPFLVVLLDPGVLVVDMQRRVDAFGNDARPEAPRGPTSPAAMERSQAIRPVALGPLLSVYSAWNWMPVVNDGGMFCSPKRFL